MKHLLFALFLLSLPLHAAEEEAQIATQTPEVKKKKKKETKVYVKADHQFMRQGPLHERKLD